MNELEAEAQASSFFMHVHSVHQDYDAEVDTITLQRIDYAQGLKECDFKLVAWLSCDVR